MYWTLSNIIKACGAAFPSGLEPNAPVTGISTDTRELQPGQLFVALKGERFDGHDFVAQALTAGATAAVVSRPVAEAERLIIVPDTLVAFGDIARAWRQSLSAQIVAITGSAGKTTTKSLLQDICAQVGSTVAARGTENNEIGVPKTLLRLDATDRFCVLEFGMRGRGEIRRLTEIAGPEVGVITTIGEAHIGRLGSREAIAESKAEMLPLLPATGTAILPADDFFFPLLRGLCPCPVLSFGFGETAEVRCLAVHEETLTSISVTLSLQSVELDLTIPLPGRHNVANCLAAAAAALALGGTLADIQAGIENYQGMEMRGEVLQGPADCTIFNDAYNANPSSVAAALSVLARAEGRRIFVFGDMLELGETAVAAHTVVGRQAAEAGVSLLVTVGEMAALAAESAAAMGLETCRVDTPEAAAEVLLPLLQPSDVVLVKASRSTALDRTVRRLIDGS